MKFVYIYIDDTEIRVYSTLKKLCINEGFIYDSKAKFKDTNNVKRLEIL